MTFLVAVLIAWTLAIAPGRAVGFPVYHLVRGECTPSVSNARFQEASLRFCCSVLIALRWIWLIRWGLTPKVFASASSVSSPK